VPTINIVMLSDAVANNRFSAEFFDPKYVFTPHDETTWTPIGRILRKCEYGISISMNTEGKGYPIFRMNELNNCFALRPEKYASIPNKVFELYRLRQNDVLFNRTNSFEFVGRTGLVKDQTDCTFASYLIRLIPDPDFILPEYLTVYLNTNFGIGQIKRRAMRSINQANVSGSEIRRVLIPVFERNIQEEIANLVNSAFEASRQSELAYTQAHQLLESELGLDKLSFQKPVGYTALFSDSMASGRIDADYFHPKYKQLDDKVARFPIKKIKTIAEKLETGVYSPAYSQDGLRYLRGVNINAGYIDKGDIVKTSCLGSTSKTIVRKDDILVTRVGSIGVCGIVEDDLSGSFFSDNLIRIRLTDQAKKELLTSYVNLLLNTTYGQMQMVRHSRGSVQKRLNQSQLAQIPIPIISLESQKLIEQLLSKYRGSKKDVQALLDQAKTRVEQLIEEAVQS